MLALGSDVAESTDGAASVDGEADSDSVVAALSAALAVGVTLLMERLDGSFHGVDELRSVGKVPVVARIPRLVSDADATRGRRRAVAWACMVLAAIVLTTAAAYATGRGHVPVVSTAAQALFLRT